ncbi:hypothetical protein L1887_24058 [Cichorium endivia]|nr:hypothetical protein L1887_24058 [Cichorium endivia]
MDMTGETLILMLVFFSPSSCFLWCFILCITYSRGALTHIARGPSHGSNLFPKIIKKIKHLFHPFPDPLLPFCTLFITSVYPSGGRVKINITSFLKTHLHFQYA